MTLRSELCYHVSRRFLPPPTAHSDSWERYSAWRQRELERQWSEHFSSEDIRGKEVIDFGCGFGNLTVYLARFAPRSITGVELEALAFEQAEKVKQALGGPFLDRVRFVKGAIDRLPLESGGYDTLLAFDCLEHLEAPETIIREFARVLRPGGKVLAWWSPFRGPYGPHMEAMIPIPWAHVIFGERALFETAARLYDSDAFIKRPWHYNDDGTLKPNPWRQWSSFKDQGYVNELTADELRAIADRAGFALTRFEPHGFSGTAFRRAVGSLLADLPVLGEYLTSYYVLECTKR